MALKNLSTRRRAHKTQDSALKTYQKQLAAVKAQKPKAAPKPKKKSPPPSPVPAQTPTETGGNQ